MNRGKNKIVQFFLVFIGILSLYSCKPKCYDCIYTNPDTQIKDTINTVCTDEPQYTGSYLQSWKVACQVAGGETVGRDKE